MLTNKFYVADLPVRWLSEAVLWQVFQERRLGTLPLSFYILITVYLQLLYLKAGLAGCKISDSHYLSMKNLNKFHHYLLA